MDKNLRRAGDELACEHPGLDPGERQALEILAQEMREMLQQARGCTRAVIHMIDTVARKCSSERENAFLALQVRRYAVVFNLRFFSLHSHQIAGYLSG